MLSEELWEHLGVDRGLVRRRAAFFAAYAEMVEEPPWPHGSLTELGRTGELPPGPGLAPFGDLPGGEDGASLERADSHARPPWVQHAERADALRECAMALLLLDLGSASKPLLAAARHYSAAGLPYGLFLRCLAEPDERRAGEAARLLISPQQADVEAPPALDAIRSPVQQTYLLLAAASSRSVADDLRGRLEELREWPQTRSTAPFGTASAPLAEWSSLALELLAYSDTEDRRVAEMSPWADSRAGLATHLTRIATRHGELLAQAQLDTFHWRHLRGVVDLVDLDLAGAACLVNRRLHQHEAPLSPRDFAELPPLSQVSLQIGLEMGRTEPGPELERVRA